MFLILFQNLQMHLFVLSSLVVGVFSQNRLPTPPKVIFGGFIPILSDHKIEPKLARNPKSLTKYIDATSRLSVGPSFPISIPSEHKFAPSEALGSFPEPQNRNSRARDRQKSHEDTLPHFPLWIPKEHTFGLEDAVRRPERQNTPIHNTPRRTKPSRKTSRHKTPRPYNLGPNTPGVFTPESYPSVPYTTDRYTPKQYTPELYTPEPFTPDGFTQGPNTPRRSTSSRTTLDRNAQGRFPYFPRPEDPYPTFALTDQMIAPTVENQFLENSTQVSVDSEQVDDSTPADQFLVPNILNFLPKFPPIRPNRPNRQKRPPRPKGPPPGQQSETTFKPVPTQSPFVPVITQSESFPPASPVSTTSSQTLLFSPVPSRPSSQQQRIPNLQKPQEPGQEEALKIFNDGLDNFITNPESFKEIPRPVNSNQVTSPLLSLPPGLSIEEKTKLLAERDPNQNFILSAPSVNAGVLPLKFQKQQPLILFPPLNKPFNNV